MARTFGIDAFRRYLTLKTHKIHALPVAILMPHSGCNCQCVMCDIWKGNGSTQQLTEADVQTLLVSLKKLGTQWVVMSGGEALMNPNLFRLGDILRAEGMKITILSTGLLLKRYADQIVGQTDEVIVSLDGSEAVHNAIRRIPNAYQKLRDGVRAVKALDPAFPISARCVIPRRNFTDWPNIVARSEIGLDQILPPRRRFQRSLQPPELWDEGGPRGPNSTQPTAPAKKLSSSLITGYAADFCPPLHRRKRRTKSAGFMITTPPFYGLAGFPPVRCNAPGFRPWSRPMAQCGPGTSITRWVIFARRLRAY